MGNKAIYIISKEEWKKRMMKFIESQTELSLRYTNLLLQEKDPRKKAWYQKQIEELSADIKFNLELLKRADIEDGYNIFWVDEEGNLLMRRCSREEYDEIYGMKRKRICYIA